MELNKRLLFSASICYDLPVSQARNVFLLAIALCALGWCRTEHTFVFWNTVIQESEDQVPHLNMVTWLVGIGFVQAMVQAMYIPNVSQETCTWSSAMLSYADPCIEAYFFITRNLTPPKATFLIFQLPVSRFECSFVVLEYLSENGF